MRSLLLLALLAVPVGCSDDHDDDHSHAARPAVCDDIASRCHPFESTSVVAKECHESAHEAWDEAACNAKKAECYMACTASDAGADTATAADTETAADSASDTETASDSASDGG